MTARAGCPGLITWQGQMLSGRWRKPTSLAGLSPFQPLAVINEIIPVRMTLRSLQALASGVTTPFLSHATWLAKTKAKASSQPSLSNASISRLSRSNPPAFFARPLTAITKATGSWSGTRLASSSREAGGACGGRFFFSLLLML